MVSPQVAALIADWNPDALPAATFRTVPVWTGMVTSTVACGSVGSTGPVPVGGGGAGERTVTLAAPDFVGSATLVAVTATTAGDGAAAGAV